MRSLCALATFMLSVCLGVSAQDVFSRFNGSCQQGGSPVQTNGVNSKQPVQISYPACTITVFDHGTVNHSSIFNDAAGAVPLPNPFTATASGNFGFYAADGRYDVMLSGAGIPTPFTISDVTLCFNCSGGGGGGGGATVNGGPLIPGPVNFQNGPNSTVTNPSGSNIQITVPASLADPGSNGPIKRTAPNVTSPALAADIIGLWTGGAACDLTTYLRGDGQCQTPPGGGGNVDAGSLQGQWPAWSVSGVKYSPQTKNVIDVRDYGVACDNVTNDTTAMNNALAAAVAVGTTTGATAHVKLPSGICVGNFTIVQGKGLKIQGAGALTTHLRSPNANPAMQINGLWYSSFSDLTFDTNLGATNAVLEIDGKYDGTHTQSVQFLTFSNVNVFGQGASDGLLSKYAVAVCRQSGGNCQGSNIVFNNAALSGASTAAYFQSGYNALSNQFNGGDFQNFTTDGMYILNGSIDVYGTTFETLNQCTQLINGGYDIHASGGSHGPIDIRGIRSEGWSMILAGSSQSVSAANISQNPPWTGYLSNHAFALNTAITQTGTDSKPHLYCMTTAGTTGASPPTWPATGTVNDGSAVWTEETYNVVNMDHGNYDYASSYTDPSATVHWQNAFQFFGSSDKSSGWEQTNIQSSFGEHDVAQGSSGGVALCWNTLGTPQALSIFGASCPASAQGIVARGGVLKLYLGDNLYEGTEGGTPATAQYHVTTTMNVDGTFATSTSPNNFSAFFAQPTINQTGSASGSATIIAAYPVLTSTKGTPLLLGLGTAASPGGARTNLFTVDPSGNTALAGNLTFLIDNTTDVGAAGATRPRTGYFGTSVVSPIVNAATGFRVNNAAPLNHCLVGDGTNYIDSATCGVANPVTGTGTNNVISKWTSASAQGDSSITDDGSTVSTTEAFSAASLGSSGANGGVSATEGTGAGVPAGAGLDVLWADSTAHRWKMNNNNGGAQNVVGSLDFVNVVNHSGTQQTSPHIVQDSCTLGTDCAVTLTGSAVYTNSTSYTCTCADDTAIAACSVAQASGSAFTITGTGTDAIRYICVGN